MAANSPNKEEWALLDPDQRDLHQKVMEENLEAVASLGKTPVFCVVEGFHGWNHWAAVCFLGYMAIFQQHSLLWLASSEVLLAMKQAECIYTWGRPMVGESPLVCLKQV
uniref:KRAB domain-containing protein n=1 Tax=Anolis carolinensis TaxID=28377 RepID=A0A803TC98_ANOCA